MRLKGQAGRTRGASLFAWHGGSSLLAVAVKRRWAGGWPVLAVVRSCSTALLRAWLAHAGLQCAASVAASLCRPTRLNPPAHTCRVLLFQCDSQQPPTCLCPPTCRLHLPACLPAHTCRVLLFQYDGREFLEQREVSLPDAPTSMQLAGGTTLYAGLPKRHASKLLPAPQPLALLPGPCPSPWPGCCAAHSPAGFSTYTPACLSCLQGVCVGGCGHWHSHPDVCHQRARSLHGGGIAHRYVGAGGGGHAQAVGLAAQVKSPPAWANCCWCVQRTC